MTTIETKDGRVTFRVSPPEEKPDYTSARFWCVVGILLWVLADVAPERHGAFSHDWWTGFGFIAFALAACTMPSEL